MIPSDVNYPLDALFIFMVRGPSVEFPSQHKLEMAEMESELLHHFLQSHRNFLHVCFHMFLLCIICAVLYTFSSIIFFLQQRSSLMNSVFYEYIITADLFPPK